MNRIRSRWLIPASLLLAGAALVSWSVWVSSATAAEVDARVAAAEQQRIAAIEKVKPTVVAIFAPKFDNGGSGVLISDDGYALTNFHVTNACGNVMRCGLPDGKLYDAVLVGLDKVGDVALIKLLPKKEGDKFPFAKLGDSDKVRAGDWSLAMGNPFLLATDFSPTVTYGLVSGVHRYQYPSGTLLEYADCIQIDTSINPGNSGGPLFNMDGELIGINGRGSFEKRGRVNSGVGYAISINQIKNFMGHLRAGLDTDHASLGALVQSDSEDGQISKYVVTNIIESDAKRRGLDIGDQVVSFAGRPIGSVNQFKNALGIYPKGWRLPLTYRRFEEKRGDEKREVLVRLMGVQRQEVGGDPMGQPQPMPPMPPGGRRPPMPPGAGKPEIESPAQKLFEPKPGFANYHFNKLERERLLTAFKKHGDFSTMAGDWTIKADALVKGKRTTAEIRLLEKGARDKLSPAIMAVVDGIDYNLEPLSTDLRDDVRDPAGSGGLLLALYQWRQLLAHGEKGGFIKDFSHGGHEPFYLPPPPQGRPDYEKLRKDCDVLRTDHTGHPAKWYFSQDDYALLGFEMTIDPEKDDPCEVYFSNYQKIDGRLLPHRIEVRNGDKQFAVFDITEYKLTAGK